MEISSSDEGETLQNDGMFIREFASGKRAGWIKRNETKNNGRTREGGRLIFVEK